MAPYRRSQEEKGEWLTSGQVCEILGISMSTLNRWVAQGKLRSRRTPGGWRLFHREDIAFMRARIQGLTIVKHDRSVVLRFDDGH